MKRYVKLSIIFFTLILLSSCGKKEEGSNQISSGSGEFGWRETISVKDIPDYPVKGKIDGKDFAPVYIIFEKWRGSNDNVIVFSDKAPKNKCGFLENDNGVQITKLGAAFEEGDFLKESFLKNAEGYSADFRITENEDMRKVTSAWNAAIKITEMEDDIVKGMIAVCFKDDKKSWIAGKFEAIICNN